MIDPVLADLLKGQGRTEQKVDDLISEVQALTRNHEHRLKKLERVAGRLMAAVAVVTVPISLLYNRYIK